MTPMKIDRKDKRGLIGINGKPSPAIGTALVSIPFTKLQLIIEVKFRIMNYRCVSLLSLHDMLKNGLDVSLQNKIIIYNGKTQELVFKNDFPKLKWTVNDMNESFYT